MLYVISSVSGNVVIIYEIRLLQIKKTVLGYGPINKKKIKTKATEIETRSCLCYFILFLVTTPINKHFVITAGQGIVFSH